MIHNDRQLEGNRRALEKAEEAMAILEHDRSTLHPDRYTLMAAPIMDDIRRLRQEIDDYLGIKNTLYLNPFYHSQVVRNEDLTIIGGTIITGTLAHQPVLAGTVVVEVFNFSVCENQTPYLGIIFSHDGSHGVLFGGSEFAIDAGATRYNNDTGVITITLSADSFPVGTVAKASYEYDILEQS